MNKDSHITSYEDWAWHYLKSYLDEMYPSQIPTITDALAVIIYSEIDHGDMLHGFASGLPKGKEIVYTINGRPYFVTYKAWDFTVEAEEW